MVCTNMGSAVCAWVVWHVLDREVLPLRKPNCSKPSLRSSSLHVHMVVARPYLRTPTKTSVAVACARLFPYAIAMCFCTAWSTSQITRSASVLESGLWFWQPGQELALTVHFCDHAVALLRHADLVHLQGATLVRLGLSLSRSRTSARARLVLLDRACPERRSEQWLGQWPGQWLEQWPEQLPQGRHRGQ